MFFTIYYISIDRADRDTLDTTCHVIGTHSSTNRLSEYSLLIHSSKSFSNDRSWILMFFMMCFMSIERYGRSSLADTSLV